MCLTTMTRPQLNRRMTALGCASILMAAGMAIAAEYPTVDAAERMDRLGAVGLLALGFIAITAAFVTVLRFVLVRGVSVIERNTDEIARASEIAKQTAAINGRVIDAIKDCEYARHRGA